MPWRHLTARVAGRGRPCEVGAMTVGAMTRTLLRLLAWGSAACLLVLPARASGGAVALDRHPEKLVELVLPEGSREGVAAPELVPVSGPWRAVSTVGGVRTWEAPLPVRPRALGFGAQPSDVYLSQADDPPVPLSVRSGAGAARSSNTWSFRSGSVRVRRLARLGPPEDGQYLIRYARATEREADLNRVESGRAPEDFAFRTVHVDDTGRHGLLLPAPARAVFALDVPVGGVLDLAPTLLPPETADLPPSDGAILRVAVAPEGGDEARVLLERALTVGEPRSLRVDLSEYGGQRARLILSTEPGGDARSDYVFLADPVVHAPVADPPRIFLVFVDTLRVDHLSLYGYTRPTSPAIDAWAQGAAVFEQARSVAPWTLPSARTMLSGVVPERWGSVETLQGRLAEEGWATAFFVANGYLSSAFEMDRDFGLYRLLNLARAGEQVDRALAFAERHADRPTFVVLHLMDMHLPYKESPLWRFRFAGLRPDYLPKDRFTLRELRRLRTPVPKEARRFITDRYDNNLAYVDSQIGRLLETLDTTTRDTVLLLSDHGEELWDHGGFEHGHTLYDELIHIPMILAGPGIPAGRYAEPVSLLDVAPTLARAAGVDAGGMEGWPLQTAADRSRAQDFAERPIAFGRPLYGNIAWGALHRAQKLIVEDGEESLFDLEKDPKEARPQVPEDATRAALHGAMAEALGTPVRIALRFAPTQVERPTRATLTLPGGVEAAWVGPTPSETSTATVTVEGEVVQLAWPAGNERTLEIFVLPAGDLTEAVQGATLVLDSIGRWEVLAEPTWDEGEMPVVGDATGAALMTARAVGAGLVMNTMAVPLPIEGAAGPTGSDAEVQGALEALGYVDP